MSKFIEIFFTIILFASNGLAQTAPRNYLSFDLDYLRYKNILAQLINKTGELKNRGEAHITIITPPEYKKLTDSEKSKISAQKISDIYAKSIEKKIKFEEICLGMGEKNTEGRLLKTYYIVVKSNDLLNIRREISKLSGLSKTEFDPEMFYPHITLGFTERDLHLDDGIIKDSKSCSKHIKINL